MYATEQGILNEQMNAAILSCNNELLKEELLIVNLLNARFGKDGDQYFYIIGELPEPECIVGFGNSPKEALSSFVAMWKGAL